MVATLFSDEPNVSLFSLPLFSQRSDSTQNAAIANVDVAKAYDLSFLKKLKDIGFNTKIGVPAQ